MFIPMLLFLLFYHVQDWHVLRATQYQNHGIVYLCCCRIIRVFRNGKTFISSGFFFSSFLRHLATHAIVNWFVFFLSSSLSLFSLFCMLYYEDFGDADADNADLTQSKDIFAKV